MGSARTFLFGTGWWTLWHLLMLGLLLPFAGLVWWLTIVKPGKGPQGGEFAAMCLMLFLAGWTVVCFVHAMMYAGWTSGGVGRYLRAGVVWLVGGSLVGWGFYKLSDIAASDSAGPMVRRAGLVGCVILAIALYAGNLIFLARARAR